MSAGGDRKAGGPWHASHRLWPLSQHSLFSQQLLSWRNQTSQPPSPFTVKPSRLQKWDLKLPGWAKSGGGCPAGPRGGGRQGKALPVSGDWNFRFSPRAAGA